MPQQKTPEPPGIVWDDETPEAKAQATAAAAPPTDMRSAGRVAFDQAKQVPMGLLRMIPDMAKGIAKIGYHGFTGNASALMQDMSDMAKGMAQPVDTTIRGAAALLKPESFQAPTREEFEQATSGATQLAAGLAIPKIPAVGRAVQRVATRAGIPQAMASAVSKPQGSNIANSPISTVVKDVIGAPVRAAARRLYDPKVPDFTIQGEFVEPPTPPPYPDIIDVQPIQPTPPPVPQGQIGGSAAQQRLLTGLPEGAPQLEPGPVTSMPPGTEGAPIPPDPRLPASYADVPAAGQPAGPGILQRGNVRLGEGGGIPTRGEQTVTGIKPKPVREGGQFRKGTEADVLKKKGPMASKAEPPTPPKRTGAKSKPPKK